MRIVIVSPEPQVHRSTLEYDLTSYFKKELKVKEDIAVQKFWSIDNMKAHSIGSGGEALVVFDKRLLRLGGKPAYRGRAPLSSEEVRHVLAEEAYKMTLTVCDEKEIPYILYEGEVERGLLDGLTNKLSLVKDRILYRIASSTFESA